MSYAAEVIADSSGKWCGNGLRFKTEAEAEEYVKNLSWRWTAVRDTRVVESTEPVNSVWTEGHTEPYCERVGDESAK